MSARDASGDASSPANLLFVDRTFLGLVIGHLETFDADKLAPLLCSHGFPNTAVELVAKRDRAVLLGARREFLIDAERDFLRARGVKPSLEREGDVVRDSDSTDEDDG